MIKRLKFLRGWAGSTLAITCLCLPTHSMGCGLKEGLPHQHFDDVNSIGKVSYWRKLDQIDLGNNLSLPLNMNFRSDRNKSSPYLGKGWFLPFLEQSFVQRNEKIFLMREPNGAVLPFRRTKGDKTILRGEQGWMAQITGEDTIKAYASCGWSMDYTDGKITDIHTPDNRVMSFNYQNGIVNSVEIDGQPLLTVDFDPQSGKVSDLSYNGKKVGFDQGSRPLVGHSMGKLLVGRIDKSLHKVTFPNGTSETYDFAVDGKMQPTLKVSGASTHSFTWDPVTRKILSDGDWTYKITRAAKDDRTIRGGRRLANAQITRTDAAGKSEYWFRDLKNKETIIQKLDGTELTKTHFGRGPLSGKLRQVEVTKDGKSTLAKQNTYDDKGNLIRQIDGKGDVLEWQTSGNTKTLVKNNVPIITTTYDDSGRPVREVDAITKVTKTYTYSPGQDTQEVIQFPNGEQLVQSINAVGKVENVATSASHPANN